ncbi:Na+/H+ antiporter NhaA [Amycolatopsis rhizosphaerae]|uniref:Na+/H+ antiporter NhaA n=1 Tax=Amycolatopsis rhizosphaerae TaxID=2053003 RepID=UPI0016437F0E|nr:Na+/H+ antiporter NhaA [Amycolatopsis rhizosphaerae]
MVNGEVAGAAWRAAVRRWLASEAAPGVALLVATLVALVWVNSPARGGYTAVWDTAFGPAALGVRLGLREWINDGVMTVFFFVIGLEIKHELVQGSLAQPRRALVPVLAALGGATVPALVFLAVAAGSPAVPGWGVPMATDPAFAVGVLALVARRVPRGVRVLLLALATVDDVFAVGVIAIGYHEGLSWAWLAAAVGGCAVIVVLRLLGVRWIWPYVPVGIVVWWCTLHSGVQASVSGVALALLTPARPVVGRAVLRELLDRLGPVSAFVAVPVFALANAGVALDPRTLAASATSRLTWAVLAGLLVGKFTGVAGSIALTTRTGIGDLPAGVRPGHVAGLGLIAGLGFTVALFVTDLAFAPPLADQSRIGILAASLIAATAAALVLSRAGRPRQD